MKGRKIIIASLGALLMAFAGISFHAGRRLKEPVVIGLGVTAVKRLSAYFSGIEGTVNDAHVYILEGKKPGGAVLLLGGSHPEEPAGRLATWLITENAVIEQGRIFIVNSANRSASTVTRLGGAYPPDYSIKTPWGEQTFRMGDRWTNPLDQWPDPEVNIHYPTRQELAYVDSRNLNRAWPGRPNGTLTEKTCYAFMELIRSEDVDLVIDLHEAELQYPVISTIVAHQKGQDVAAMSSMMISDSEGFEIGVEYSPPALRGLSHREIGDHSKAASLLLETPEPFLDATRGRTDRELLLSGKDPFVVKAGRRGLLFEKIDENGWPLDVRIGRHLSSILRILEVWSSDKPDRTVVLSGVPHYHDVIRMGAGAFLHDPSAAESRRVFFE